MCSAELDSFGLPRPNTGNFASVYKMENDGKCYAVRCFLTDVSAREERYKLISEFVMRDDLPYTVDFQYLPQGILVKGDWYPILRMEWVEGDTLDQFIEKHLHEPESLRRVAANFADMCRDLLRAGVAHGDFQHGNILVLPDGQLRLVDYDGFFVPAMEGWSANELGHRNYQHPQRNARNFDSNMDNFSSWVIYLSLIVLADSETHRRQFHAGDDALLFRQPDLQKPFASRVFQELFLVTDDAVRELTNSVLWLLQAGSDAHIALGTAAPSTVSFVAEISDKPAVNAVRNGPIEWWRDFMSDQGAREIYQIETELQHTPRKLRNAWEIFGKHENALRNFCIVSIAGLINLALFPYLSVFIFLPISLCLLVDWFAFIGGSHPIQLIEQGTAVPAKILRKEIENHQERKYVIHYEYPVKQNGLISTMSGVISVTHDQWNLASTGETLTALYNPLQPNKSTLYRFCIYKAAE